MNLYKVSQNDNNGYDTFSDMVVCAKDEQHARSIHPYDTTFPGINHWDHGMWCTSPEDATVIYLGEARNDIGPGVICASFHAG